MSSWRCLLLVRILIVLVLMSHGLLSEANTIDRLSKIELHSDLTLVINLIWEGQDIRTENIDAIVNFRKKNSDLVFIQLLNPAYFYKKGASPVNVVSQIKRTLKDTDISGMHLHPWHSYITAAGIPFKDQPSFWNTGIELDRGTDDKGHDVPLTSYTETEFAKMLRFGRQTLVKHGFKKPNIFMAGGWLTSTQIQRTAAQNGFIADISALIPSHSKAKLELFPIQKWITKLWGHLSMRDQARTLDLGQHHMMQLIQNGGNPQYLNSEEMYLAYIQNHNLSRYSNSPSLLVLSLYQETALEDTRVLNDALNLIRNHACKEKIKISNLKSLAALKEKQHLRERSDVNWHSYGKKIYFRRTSAND